MRQAKPHELLSSVASFPTLSASRLHKGPQFRDGDFAKQNSARQGAHRSALDWDRRAEKQKPPRPRKGTAALATPTLHVGLFHLLRMLLGHLLVHCLAGIHLALRALGGGRLAGGLIGPRSSLSLLREGGGGNGGADGGGHQDRKNTHVWVLGSGAS